VAEVRGWRIYDTAGNPVVSQPFPKLVTHGLAPDDSVRSIPACDISFDSAFELIFEIKQSNFSSRKKFIELLREEIEFNVGTMLDEKWWILEIQPWMICKVYLKWKGVNLDMCKPFFDNYSEGTTYKCPTNDYVIDKETDNIVIENYKDDKKEAHGKIMDKENEIKRYFDEKEAFKKICPFKSNPTYDSNCYGSDCMLWRWNSLGNKGYCGMGSKP
jgi:hypothetical protein